MLYPLGHLGLAALTTLMDLPRMQVIVFLTGALLLAALLAFGGGASCMKADVGNLIFT